MLHLPERYSLAASRDAVSRGVNALALALGASARWIDEIASDFVLWRSTRFSWAQVRLARQLGFNLTSAASTSPQLLRAALLARLATKKVRDAAPLRDAIDALFPAQNEAS